MEELRIEMDWAGQTPPSLSFPLINLPLSLSLPALCAAALVSFSSSIFFILQALSLRFISLLFARPFRYSAAASPRFIPSDLYFTAPSSGCVNVSSRNVSVCIRHVENCRRRFGPFFSFFSLFLYFFLSFFLCRRSR